MREYSSLVIMQQTDTIVNECNTFEEDDIEETVVEIPVDLTLYMTEAVIGHGSLSDRFRMTLHEDNTYSDNGPIVIALGSVLFTKINWISPIDKMSFYVDTCSYESEGYSIDIVKVRTNKSGSLSYPPIIYSIYSLIEFK